MEDKPWYKSLTFWGAVCVFVSGGLNAIGATGYVAVLEAICAVLGIPMIAYGIRRALVKKK